MLNPQLIRKNLPLIQEALARRGFTFPAEEVQALVARTKQLQGQAESLRARRNELAALIGKGKQQKADTSVYMAEAALIPAQVSEVEVALAAEAGALNAILEATPNLPHVSVPEGEGEEDNVQVRAWGDVPEFAFEPRDHVALGEKLGLDFEAGVKLAGARFTVLAGGMAKLHRALIQFMLDTHSDKHGYTEVYVPYLVNEASMRGTGQLPKFKDDLFAVPRQGAESLYLIPTAEVPVTNLARDVIYDELTADKKLVCHTPCFRSEAGSAGRDTKGLIRQHQFEKVELVRIVTPERSYAALEELTAEAETILQLLGLPYRVMSLCGGDLGFSAAKTFDLEVWLPGQGKYREISSCSNFEDFQARRLQARYRPTKGAAPQLVHTVNGSGLAVGRTLVAILENFQQADGSVLVPKVLQPYLGGTEVFHPAP